MEPISWMHLFVFDLFGQDDPRPVVYPLDLHAVHNRVNKLKAPAPLHAHPQLFLHGEFRERIERERPAGVLDDDLDLVRSGDEFEENLFS